MISFVSGIVDFVGENYIVVDVNGIGYQVYASATALAECGGAGSKIRLCTYMYIREDEVSLYGFSREEERKLFLRLISIAGVGPKMGMAILAGLDLKTLLVAITTSDIKTLAKIKGLGKKTAEIICASLKEELAKDFAGGNLPDSISPEMSDAVFALSSLGISQTDAVAAVQDAQRYVQGVENIIAYVLRNYKK